MDFEALIRKHVGEDGTIKADDIGKVAAAIAKAVGNEFVDKKRYDAKLTEIDDLTTAKNAAEDRATAAEQWKSKHDTLQQKFDAYKTEVAGEKTLSAKKAAHRKLMEALNIDSADIDLIMAGTQYDGMEMGDDGNLKDADKLTESIKTNYARYIPTTRSKGDNPANPPRDNDGGNGANPRAAERAKLFHERRYGPAPGDGANDKQ